MKILIIARGYPTAKYNLNGIFEFDQAKALAKIGHKVFFLCLDIRSIRRVRRFGTFEIEKDGVLIHNTSIPCGRAPRQIQELISRAMLRKQYPAFVKKHGTPDIVHAHFLEYGYYAVKELKKTGIPILITEHSSGITDGLIDDVNYKMGCTAYKEADRLICVSNALAKQIKGKFDVEVQVIPNIVDTKVFQYNAGKKKTNGFTFISVANLNALKRISFLVEVFADIAKEIPDIQLILVGDGPEKSHIMEKIKQLNLEKMVFLLGQQSRKAIKNIFDKSDCFILPSAVETFGVSYIEAMASGLPVIATKCGGPEDFVNESNGILVEVDNRKELYRAMKKIIKHVKEYDSENISQKITDKYLDIRIAKQIEDIYLKSKREKEIF